YNSARACQGASTTTIHPTPPPSDTAASASELPPAATSHPAVAPQTRPPPPPLSHRASLAASAAPRTQAHFAAPAPAPQDTHRPRSSAVQLNQRKHRRHPRPKRIRLLRNFQQPRPDLLVLPALQNFPLRLAPPRLTCNEKLIEQLPRIQLSHLRKRRHHRLG